MLFDNVFVEQFLFFVFVHLLFQIQANLVQLKLELAVLLLVEDYLLAGVLKAAHLFRQILKLLSFCFDLFLKLGDQRFLALKLLLAAA